MATIGLSGVYNKTKTLARSFTADIGLRAQLRVQGAAPYAVAAG